MCSRPDVTRARIAYSDKADEEQMVVGCNRKFLLNICQSFTKRWRRRSSKSRILSKQPLFLPTTLSIRVDVTHIRLAVQQGLAPPPTLFSPGGAPPRLRAQRIRAEGSAHGAFLERAGAEGKGLRVGQRPPRLRACSYEISARPRTSCTGARSPRPSGVRDAASRGGQREKRKKKLQ